MATRTELEKAIALLSASDDPADKLRVQKLQKMLESTGEETLLDTPTFQTPAQIAAEAPPDKDVPATPGPDSIRAQRLEAGRRDMERRYRESIENLRAPEWYEQFTTPEMGELYGQVGMTGALMPALLNPVTAAPAAALMIPAEATAGAGMRSLFSMLPWNEETREEEQQLGEVGSWNPLKGDFWRGGTGYLGSLERGVKYGALGHTLGPLISGTAQATRRGILGFKAGSYQFDPFSPLGKWGVPFLGRQGLKAEDQETIEAFIKKYEDLGLEPPSYRIAQRSLIRGLPALSKVPYLGYNVAKQITNAIGGTRKFFVDQLASISPVFSKFDISNDMYLASVGWTERQIRAYRQLYDDAFDFVETGGLIRGTDITWKGVGNRKVFDLDPLFNEINNVLGKGKVLKPMVPERVRNWITAEMSNLPRNVSVREFRDIQATISRELRSLGPRDEGFVELVQLQNAAKESMTGFYTHADEILGGNIGRQIKRNFDLANRAVRRFDLMLRTPTGFKQVEGAWGEARHALPESGVRFEKGGSLMMDQLFDEAFVLKSPKYLKRLKTILGYEHDPTAWNRAVTKKLNNAMDNASTPKPGSEYSVFNHKKFLESLGLDESDEMLRILLDGTGVNPQMIKNVGSVLSEYPITPEIQQMMVRRVGLAGPKALATMGVGGIIGSATSGGILGGATAGIIAILFATRLSGKMLASPKMIKNLTKLGQTERQMIAGKVAKSTYGYAITQTLRVLLEIQGFEEEFIQEEIAKIQIQSGRTLKEYAAAIGSRYQ